MVEDMPSISEEIIEKHEEQAEIAFIFIEATGLLAIITLFSRLYFKRLGQRLTLLTLVALIISGGLIAWTANLGGKIRHVEIRSNIDDIISPTQGLYEGHKDD
ncbi:hypothetical protein MYX76_15180 [Desulfobacterota bacterium AH_259_B03_O07]|nr:hypothetical protein [Desulfobacterota bacterium AH_259_B03_O07]